MSNGWIRLFWLRFPLPFLTISSLSLSLLSSCSCMASSALVVLSVTETIEGMSEVDGSKGRLVKRILSMRDNPSNCS